jgi:hypothetical protein
MHHAPIALAILAGLSTPALVVAQPAQRVAFAPQFEQGQSMLYSIGLDSSITQKEGDLPAFGQRVAQEIVLDLEVVSVDERGAVIDGEVKGLDLSAMWGGRMFSYVWPRVTTDVPMRLPPIIILERLGEAARDVRVKIRVEFPSEGGSGSVVVSGFEDVAASLDGQDVFDMTMLGLLANEQMADALESVFFVDGAPDKQIRVGTGWQTENRVNLGPAGAIDVTTEWVFKSLDGSSATVTGAPRAAVARPVDADPASPSVAIEEQSSSIEILWNTEVSRVESRTSKQTMTTMWTLGPLKLSQMQDTTLSVTRKK